MSVWDRLKGSEAAERLCAQMAGREVAHAWLLLGPAGSGKLAAAVAMAASLNCKVAPGEGCGECRECLRVLRRHHPDVHHVVPEGPLIPVGVVRESIIPEAARSPFEGPYKVFIIEEADRMNDEAQNALLKSLEEPQGDTVFILLSEHEQELLETICSRCRVVRLDAVPEERIVAMLTEEGASNTDALLAARVSDGDLERARTFALDDATSERRRLWLGIPRRLASPVDALDSAAEVIAEAKEVVKRREALQKAEVTDLAEAMGDGRGTAAARNALATRHKRELRRVEEEILGEAIQSLASFYRDVLVLRVGGTDAVANLDVLEEIESWVGAGEIPDAALVQIIDRCIATRATFTRNANATLQMEALLLEIGRLAPAPSRVGSAW